MRKRLIRILRVRERPEPPPGSGSDLAVFRASPQFLWYSVLMWFPAQVVALVGLVASLAFFGTLGPEPDNFDLVDRVSSGLIDGLFGQLGSPLMLAIHFFETLAIGAWFFQLIFTGGLMKLAWELRWYMVGDETLRVREGLWVVREQTMTIARIQNMAVHQGPVQKLFGISDLEIHAAGGGGGGEEAAQGLRIVRMRGLEDAESLRDRILERLKAHRGAGLGDADDRGKKAIDYSDLAAAAKELRDEARALRQAQS